MKRPYDADTLLIALKQREIKPSAILPPKGICGAIIGSLNTACGGKQERDKLLFHLFDVTTSKELADGQWVALSEWVGVFKNDNSPPRDYNPATGSFFKPAWGYSEYLNAECLAILDSIRYNGMTEEEREAELRSRVVANATQYTSPMTQTPPASMEEDYEEIGY